MAGSVFQYRQRVVGGLFAGDASRATMNWEAVGALGEILGAIVVVGTLLYLSRQIAQQSVAANLELMIEVTIAHGFDNVLVETAGAGQGDTAIRALVDLVVLLVQPQTGDEMQWQKAGLLEVADLIVVNKSDLPGAERVQRELAAQLNPPGRIEVPIVLTSLYQANTIDALWNMIQAAKFR